MVKTYLFNLGSEMDISCFRLFVYLHVSVCFFFYVFPHLSNSFVDDLFSCK